MKRGILFLLAFIIVAGAALPAWAWEFTLSGEYVHRLRYFSRTGDKDLFGDARAQDGPVIIPPARSQWVGFAGPNYYLTGARVPAVSSFAESSLVRITRGGFSRFGCDALVNDLRLTLYPQIKVNEAVRIRSVFTIGGVRHKFARTQSDDDDSGDTLGTPPLERYYMSQTSQAAYNTASLISVEQLRATIELPFGILSMGIKDFPFGTGATFAMNTRAEHFLFVVPYGPFRFLWAIWLGNSAAFLLPNAVPSQDPPFRDLFGLFTVPDSYTKPTIYQGFGITYRCTGLSTGAFVIYRQFHQNANLYAFDIDLGDNEDFGPIVRGAARDHTFQQYMVFMKYTNGLFFANAEYEWQTRDVHFIYNREIEQNPVGAGSPRFREGYHAFAEIGTLMGPAKLSLMYAQASGEVRNLFHMDNNFGNRTKRYIRDPINYQAMEPYNYLMFYTYAGGNQEFHPDGTGQMSDAYAFAGRLDYAVAANLNCWGSFIWAHRLETAGTLAGQIDSTGEISGNRDDSGAAYTQFDAQAFKGTALGLAPAGLNPYADDGLIGWEANVGIDWKILEGVTWASRYAYWQPGGWFTQAYRAITLSGNPGRTGNGILETRDAIHAFHGEIVIDF